MTDKLDCWYQRADCSTDEYAGISADNAIAKFHAVDWSAAPSDNDGDDDDNGCAPGFGVHLADGSKLDMRPAGRTMACDFHYFDGERMRSALSAPKVAHRGDVMTSAAEKLIKAAYAGDRRAILAELGGA